jgi:hypothetical protein
MKTLEIALLGGGAIVAGYLFLTKDGKEYLNSLTSVLSGESNGLEEGGGGEEEGPTLEEMLVDYRKTVSDDPDAFTPGTSRYQEIIRKNRGKEAASALFKRQ